MDKIGPNASIAPPSRSKSQGNLPMIRAPSNSQRGTSVPAVVSDFR